MLQFLKLPEIRALRELNIDGRWLFVTRTVRMFAYGFVAVILVLYLHEVGLSDTAVGALLTATLLGDVAISLWITGNADRIGRRRMLIIGCGLMMLAGIAFVLTDNWLLLALAATIGTISPSGNEVGPFSPIEQAALPQTAPAEHRTQIFAWYNLVGSLATAVGGLIGGGLTDLLQHSGMSALSSYRVPLVGYTLIGVLLAVLFTRLSPQIEAPRRPVDAPVVKTQFGLHRSRGIVLKLSALFMLDSFAGGLVVLSWVTYWFHVKYGVEPAALGAIFFGANLLAGLSSLAAARVARRFGLLNTMIWTHAPSNILLILVPLMPNMPLAILMLLLRFSISQMDVPTRQSYTVAVVDPDERSAAAGITNIARTAALSVSPSLTGALFSAGLLSVPFLMAGSLKLVYDFALARSFQTIKPEEERTSAP